jgi:hypothetical protein
MACRYADIGDSFRRLLGWCLLVVYLLAGALLLVRCLLVLCFFGVGGYVCIND